MSDRRFLLLASLCVALIGCATSSPPVSVADTIAVKPQLSTLNGLLAKAGLTESLKGAGPFTVFAPSNEAFAKVPAKTMDELGSDSARLKAVLAFHVLPGKVMAADVKNGNVKTVQGANVALATAGSFVTIEEALVTQADVAATNGVVHVIDKVLMPPRR